MLRFKGKLEKLTWGDLRENIARINPEFVKIVDSLSLNKNYWIAKVSYPYGSLVLDKSKLMLPNKHGDIVSITDPTLEKEISDGLSYNMQSNPVSLVLDNSFEIFLPLSDRTIMITDLLKPGTLFGASVVLNPNSNLQPAFIWEMTAGARSVFMLPKISEAKKHLNLKKKYSFNLEAPRDLMSQWRVFREIINSKPSDETWTSEILYFPRQWFENVNDPEWSDFFNYFYKCGWRGSQFWQNQAIWNLIYSLIINNYEINPKPYAVDTVKYLIHAGVGAVPGFSPATDDSAGPIGLLQKIYLEDYGLKNYPPIIMQPNSFDMYDPNSKPIYYPLQYPSAFEFKPSSRARKSLISDLYEIKSLLQRHKAELLSNKFNIKNTMIYDLFNITDYSYYHASSELHNEIQDSTQLPLTDERFLKTCDGKDYNAFPSKCTFAKGCIKIHKK